MDTGEARGGDGIIPEDRQEVRRSDPVDQAPAAGQAGQEAGQVGLGHGADLGEILRGDDVGDQNGPAPRGGQGGQEAEMAQPDGADCFGEPGVAIADRVRGVAHELAEHWSFANRWATAIK